MALGTYLRTWATVLGPYHWPMDLPSPTPICAAKKHIQLVTHTPAPTYPHRRGRVALGALYRRPGQAQGASSKGTGTISRSVLP